MTLDASFPWLSLTTVERINNVLMYHNGTAQCACL